MSKSEVSSTIWADYRVPSVDCSLWTVLDGWLKFYDIKRFFSTPMRPVQNNELMELMNADKSAYDEIAKDCAIALGVTLDEEK